MNKVLVIGLLSIIGFALFLTVLEMPDFGKAEGPTWEGSARDYLSKTKEDTKALNVISAVLVDYRAYDTLIETTVLFTATIGVLTLFYNLKKKGD